jgi:hypothetical protein
MSSNSKNWSHRWLALVLCVFFCAATLFLFAQLPVSEAQGQYIPPTETQPSGPYPGIPSPTTQQTAPAVTKPPATPTSQLSATPTISATLSVTGTLTVSPQPTLDLLFPGELPQTASATPVIIYIRDSGSTGTALGPPARLLVVIVILLWGLLGTFLVVYIRRLGY